MNLSLLWHTVKPLRWEQIVYRPLRMAQFRAYRLFPQLSKFWTRKTPSPQSLSSEQSQLIQSVFNKLFAHLNQPLEQYDAALVGLQNGQFTFLHKTLTIPQVNWNHRYDCYLWNYQFHYFSWALWCARAYCERGDRQAMARCQQLIESWISEAQIGRSDGWDAYPISLRVVNWIYAYSLLADQYEDQAFLVRWRASIYVQLQFLYHHLEYHLLANHLLKNAKALVIGGLFFLDEPQGRKWLAFGEKLLWREFAEQVLSDGGHYERSTMYHALCLADFLECYALIQAFSEEGKWASFALRTKDVATKLKAMASFLQMISYADDSLALFNDSGNSDEARPFPLLETAQRILREAPVANTQSFPETGYFIWQSADQSDHLIVDGGVPAVHYNLAHAHCDLLSYELRLGGHPFIVDSGVHGYGGDPYREYSRSTRAHNTVMFDEQEQSEVWDTFRMGRTALPVRAAVQGSAAEWEFCGAYRSSQDQSFEHERRIRIDADGSFVIEDRVTKGQPQQARSYIHLHPMVNAIFQTDGGRKVICKFSSQIIQIEPYNECDALLVTGSLSPIQGWYFPDFGVAQASPTICFTYQVSKAQLFGYRIRKLQ